MILGIPAADLAVLAAALLVAGAFTGVLAGLFGVGGGAVIVPALYEVFRVLGIPDEVRTPLAVGTSLAIIIPTSIRSFQAHRARGAVDMEVLRAWAVPVVVGVASGSVLAAYAPPAVFKLVFVFVALLSAFKLLFGRETWRLGVALPKGAGMVAYGGGIGVLSSLMGIGGGQLANLVLTLYGRPIHNAIATASGLGVLISIPGAIGFVAAGWAHVAQYPNIAALQMPLTFGYVSLLGAAMIVPTSMAFAPFGARLAHRTPKRRLEIAFGLFLLVVSARFIWSLIA